MVLKATNLSIIDIATEFDENFSDTKAYKLTDLYAGGGIVPSTLLDIPTEGEISISDFYGADRENSAAWLISSNPEIGRFGAELKYARLWKKGISYIDFRPVSSSYLIQYNAGFSGRVPFNRIRVGNSMYSVPGDFPTASEQNYDNLNYRRTVYSNAGLFPIRNLPRIVISWTNNLPVLSADRAIILVPIIPNDNALLGYNHPNNRARMPGEGRRTFLNGFFSPDDYQYCITERKGSLTINTPVWDDMPETYEIGSAYTQDLAVSDES